LAIVGHWHPHGSEADVDQMRVLQKYAQDLAIAKEVGDRAGGGGGDGIAYGNLGTANQSQGHFCTAIEYHTQCLVIAKSS
jgi:hypothetical protein